MKKISYVLFDALLHGSDLRGARDYLEHRPIAEKKEYAFFRSWSELLWRESKPRELQSFTDAVPNMNVEFRALRALSQIRVRFSCSEFKEGVEIGEAILQSAPVLEDRLLRPQIRFALAKCWRSLRRIDRALIEYEEALEEFDHVGAEIQKADCLSSIAQCRRTMRDWDGCVALYSQAILVHRSNGQVLLSLPPTLNRGALHLFRGHFSAAKEDIETALRIARSYRRDPKLVGALAAMGLLEARSDSFDSSAKTLASALRIARAQDLVRHRCLLFEYIGELRFRQGKARSARVWLNRAVALSQTRGLRDIEHESRCRLAEVELQDGNLDLAESHVREAYTNFVSMKDQYEIAVCQRVLGEVLWIRNKTSEANVLFDHASEFFSAVGELYESQKIARIRSGSTQPQTGAADPVAESPTEAKEGEHTAAPAHAYAPGIRMRKARPKKSGSSFQRSWHPLFPDLLSESPVFIAALDQIAECASANASVLILGESGTGKEAVARGIHRLSPQSEGEFVPFNCSTSTPHMFDAEFYGHTKGSFTGADNKRLGLARAADGGTLFLDEIGELGMELQGRILRFLDSGEIRPVGSDRSLEVNVRIVAATHRQLDVLTKAKRFRHDLRYRISELAVKLPPLRERQEDIPLLVDYYFEQACQRGIGRSSGIGKPVINSMLLYSWPGNVRELRNEVFTLLSVCPEGERVMLWKRPHEDVADVPKSTREALIAALENSKGNVSRAGRLLGENRVSLYRLMRKLNIDPNHYRNQ